MRIGILADIYKPRITGVTHHISLTKDYLRRAGNDVFLFTFGDEEYVDDEPNVIRSAGLPMFVPVVDMNININIRLNRKAQELLRTMDIVHVHHPFLSGPMAIRYCKPRGIPLVFTNHTRYDLYYQAYYPKMPEALGETFLKSYLPPLFKSYDLVIAPSNGMRGVLKKLGVKSSIEIVPNGVDLKPIQSTTVFDRKEELGFSENDIVFIFVGRIGPEKNIPFLLRSFAGVAEAYDNVRLLIVGDGPEKDNLEDRVKHMGIENLVTFTGMIPYDEIPKYLNSADVFSTASVTEVHPLTVIEAMAAGLPTLGIHSPGVGDTIVDGETGYLSQEDLAGFTAKMTKMVTDKNKRLEMGRNAKSDSQNYSIENTCELLLEKYSDLIEKKKHQKRPWYQNFLSKDKISNQ